jgi:predicted ATP-binding protein involved in virulence
MKKTMHQIHQEVFDLLMRYHIKDKNFLFTFRQINRAEKLDKGYWFLGNDDYLAVSFWTGTDWISKTPRIYFKIKKDGTSSLECRHADTESHSDYFPYSFLKEIGAKSINYNKGYSKKYKGNDYLNSLKNFISNEKVYIDQYIRNEEDAFLSAIQWAEPIYFIGNKEFEIRLKKIKEYQKKIIKKNKNLGSIKNIEIKNFGPIKDVSILDIPLKTKWIYLTGENGAGKTSVLKAIATGLCQNNDQNEPVAKSEQFGKYKISIDLHEEDNSSKRYTVEPHLDFLNKKNISKGFASYGPVRIATEGAIDLGIITNSKNVHEKATFGLFNPIGILKDLSNDYTFLTKPKYQEVFKEGLISNLKLIIPNKINVKEDDNGKLLFFESSQNTENLKKGIPFEKLPSGTRSFVSLIIDLLIRLQHQQPEIIDLADHTGVVLIDEIDIHLHPKLQLEFINQLSETFPKLQFIVSTHSPIPFLGAPENSVFIKVSLNSFEKGVEIVRLKKIEKEIKYLLPNTILTSDIFDFDILEDVPEEKMDKMFLEDNYDDIVKYKEVDERLKSLDKSIFPDNLFNDNN